MSPFRVILCAWVLCQFASAAFAAAPTLTPTPTPAAPRERLLVLDLEASSIEVSQAQLLQGVMANALSDQQTLDVVTAQELITMANLESERQVAGCDTTSCLAELAGALGARYVVYGQVGRIGQVFLAQLNLFDSHAAQAINRQEVKARDLTALVDALPEATRTLVAPLVQDPQGAAPVAAASSSSGNASTWLYSGLAIAAVGIPLLSLSAAMFVFSDWNAIVPSMPLPIGFPDGDAWFVPSLIMDGFAVAIAGGGVFCLAGGGALVAYALLSE